MNVFEKLSILKKLSFFSSTRDDLLIQIAEHMKEIKAKKEEIIIQKGDVDSSLYIIISGAVMVYDNDKTITELFAPDVFGELAALSPEKRTASIKCSSDSSFLKLEHEILFELIELEPVLCKGIIHFLCNKLRKAYSESLSKS